MHKQAGNILLLTLITASLILLMTAVIIEITIINLKTQQAQQQAFMALQQAETVIQDIKKSLDLLTIPPPTALTCHIPFCIHQLNTANNFFSQPLSWWQMNALPIINANNIRAYYYIEEYSSEQKNTLVYYRVTVLGFDNDQTAKQIIQVMLVKHFVDKLPYSATMLGWRRLDSLND